jgi:signal transduction histidine kinase/CheY-like chemotaxis protein
MRPADAYPFRTLPTPWRFAIALAAVSVVFAVDRLGGPVVDDGTLFLLLSVAVMASAWFAGTGPALASVVMGAVTGSAVPGDAATAAGHQLQLAVFVAEGLVVTAVISELRSARRSAEREARHAQAARREGESANRMKDEFLATVSHELRTPLNAVLGWVHLLRTGKLDSPTASRGLESIERNVRLQAHLTGDLLDVSRALTGQLQIDTQPTALNDAVRNAAAAVTPSARAKGLDVNLTIPDEPIVVLGDAARLRQVVWHLLANAIKFTPRGGEIVLSIGATDDEAWLTVRDSGTGIDPAFLPRIFDRFTQADSSPTRSAGGLGVGLALVRELVELHGGSIEARNCDGGGATFTARFPAQPADLLHPGAPSSWKPPVAVGAPLDGLRVLVLDRDREVRELMQTILQERGATVRAVGSVADALESLEGWSPDVLVRDGLSPGQDSYAVVAKVQSLDADRGGRIPALALTSAARSDERLAGMLAGAHSDLPKPVEPSLLAAEVARLAGRERRRAQR